MNYNKLRPSNYLPDNKLGIFNIVLGTILNRFHPLPMSTA